MERETDRAMAGTRSETGVEWATTGTAGAVVVGAGGAVVGEAAWIGPASGWEWSRAPQLMEAAATRSRAPATTHQSVGPRVVPGGRAVLVRRPRPMSPAR